MRRLMKRVAAAVLTAACLFSLSACSAKQDETAAQETLISTEGMVVEDAMGESIKLSAAQTLGGNTEQLVIQKSLLEAQGDVMGAELYAKQIEIRQELGELKDIDLEAAQVLLLADGSYTVTMPVTFAEGTMQYVLNLNLATQEIKNEFTDLSAGEEEDQSIGALMETAFVYSAIGIGTVFAVLVFISLLIYCFKFIHQWENSRNAKAPAEAPKAAPVSAPAVSAASSAPAAGDDLMEDAELVAVISAAIAAYEGTSSNGLVVRSIRRVQKTRR